jgi:CBF1 interacting corepressor
MVQGLAFLSKKGFNPQNQSNRKQVWEAQQDSKLEKERIRRREEQLRREREDEELCAARHNGDASQAQLRFMYDAPPGLTKNDTGEKSASGSSSASAKDITQVQPGDDAAAAEFRRMLAASVSSQTISAETDPGADTELGDTSKFRFAPVLQGSTMEQDFKNNDTRSALEKAVGRKDRGSALTLEEQIQRFPQLKNAPMAKGMSTTDVNVNFKPLGSQLRNVKCLACGVWGHSRGDRECQMTGWDPFSSRPSTGITASAVQPSKTEKETLEKQSRQRDDRSESSSSSSSSNSSDSSRRRRNRKHQSKHRKRDRDLPSRKHSHRKHRSRSPSRRSKSRKSHSNKRSRRED